MESFADLGSCECCGSGGCGSGSGGCGSGSGRCGAENFDFTGGSGSSSERCSSGESLKHGPR